MFTNIYLYDRRIGGYGFEGFEVIEFLCLLGVRNIIKTCEK